MKDWSQGLDTGKRNYELSYHGLHFSPVKN